MSNKSPKFARAAMIALMLVGAPVASAVALEANPAVAAQQSGSRPPQSAPTLPPEAAVPSAVAEINPAALQHA